MKLLHTILAAGVVMFAGAATAQAQGEFPTEPVTLIVPFSPGGSNDIVGRYVAESLSEVWGQPVVVENRPGAGAAIGAAYVSQQDPDGYTLLICSITCTMNQNAQSLPYDPAEDFTPIAMLGRVPLVMVTGPSLDVDTIEEFLEIARSKELNYATSGRGNVNQFAAELIGEAAGLNMTPVHYKGGSEAMTDVMGGHADLFMSSMTQAIPQIEAGNLTGLVVTSDERSEAAPDIPTLTEAGIEGVDVEQWWGIWGPVGMPEDLVAQINEDINTVLGSDKTKEFLAQEGGRPVPMAPEEFDGFYHEQLQQWQEIAQKAGISPETSAQ